MNKKWTAKRILAIAGIALLVGMYIASLILAIIHSEAALTFLKVTLGATLIIPIAIYFILMFFRLSKPKSTPEEKVYAPEDEDPFTKEDIKEISEDSEN